MFQRSGIFRHWWTRLAVLVTIFMIVLTHTFLKYPPHIFQKWDKSSSDTRETSMNYGGISALTTSSLSCLHGGDLTNLRAFSSHCSIDRLIRLSDIGDFSATDNYNVRNILAGMTENPSSSNLTCPRMLKVSNFPIPRTCLLSFPGSGNTWMRHLVQQLTGLHSGSIYKDALISHRGFPYGGVIDNMIVVKSHRPPQPNGVLNAVILDKPVGIQFDRLFILLRNPYAAMLAEFKRGKLKLGKVGNTNIDPMSAEWNNSVFHLIKTWERFITGSFSTNLPFIVIYYEDLQSCLLPEMVKISSFFRSKYLNQFAFCCMSKEQEGSFHRPSSNQTIKDAFTSQQRAIVNEAILKIASSLNKLYPGVARRILGYTVL